MSTAGTRTNSKEERDIRLFNFTQQVPNPETSDPLSNPFGNTVRIRFPFPQSFKSAELALADLFIFYSWYNIGANFGNNVFSYSFPTAAGYQTFNVTIPDGFYTLDNLNQFFQQIQQSNGTYLIDVSGNPVYFLFWVVNTTYYRVTLFSNPIPAGGAGFTVPANYPGGGPPASAQDPILFILDTHAPAGSSTPGAYSFSKTLGYSPGPYPPMNVATTGVAQSYNGQFPPVIESTTSVQVACSLANSSGLTDKAQVFYTFSPNVAFGEQVQISPPFPRYVPVTDGFYNYMDVYFVDENGKLLNLQDPHLSGTLMIRGK